METVELIFSNMDFFDRLTKAGKISLAVKQELDIYQYWVRTKGSKMQRYCDTAEAMGVSEMTVRRAVKEMRKVI